MLVLLDRSARFSRFVLASDLKPDMTADSISDEVEQAVAFTGMRRVPVENRTKLLSDHGSGYLARAFEEYLLLRLISRLHKQGSRVSVRANTWLTD